MDIIKQPQNIMKIVKKIWKKYPRKELNEKYFASCSALFTSGKAVQLTWYEFSTFNHYKTINIVSFAKCFHFR